VPPAHFFEKDRRMDYKDKARQLLEDFKEGRYIYGAGIFEKAAETAARKGRRAVMVSSTFSAVEQFVNEFSVELEQHGIELVDRIDGPKPNCPVPDLLRITEALKDAAPDMIISFGGGSVIDGSKAANVLAVFGGDIDDYFGSGMVSEKMEETAKPSLPHMAVQTASGSAAHLTKYSNITNPDKYQKKLIVDEAIVPEIPVFDHRLTYSAPRELTLDGALDGIAHIIEVLYGAVGKSNYEKIAEIAEAGMALILENLPFVVKNPQDKAGREGLALGTDLGGYCIMVNRTRIEAHRTDISSGGSLDLTGRQSSRKKIRRSGSRSNAGLFKTDWISNAAFAGRGLYRCTYRKGAGSGEKPSTQDEAREHAWTSFPGHD
jgi:alcohol dehydrogenase class IV